MLPSNRVNEAIRRLEDMFPGTWDRVLKFKTWQYSDKPDVYPELESDVAEIMRRILESSETLEFVRDEEDDDRRNSILILLVGQIFVAADESVRSVNS